MGSFTFNLVLNMHSIWCRRVCLTCGSVVNTMCLNYKYQAAAALHNEGHTVGYLISLAEFE